MKFRTTILLIIFSFSLLMIWERWISYNNKTTIDSNNVNSVIAPVSETPKSTALTKNSSSEVPELISLDKSKAKTSKTDNDDVSYFMALLRI